MTPARIAVTGLSFSIGDFHISGLDFALSGGEILVILGPNGAGKSVLLETIAGFHRPDAGSVLIGGRDVTELPPERRNVAFLVQNFGLFPHLTVEQNVAIALRGERANAADAALPYGDVAKLLAHFEVGHLARRTPQTLSPGEKQRVALARALAAQPDLFLFDEPFSALDAQTREQLRDELLAFLRRLSLPAIFVTHDHTDALTLADKVVVLRGGAVMQSGPAAEVFQKPANSFVARFIGIENVLAGRLTRQADGPAAVTIGERSLRLAAPIDGAVDGREVLVSIRAEDVNLAPPGNGAAGVNRLAGRVSGLRRMGPLVVVLIDCGFALKAYALAQQLRALALEVGAAVDVEIAADAIHVMMD
jgi:ABC-type Fe3+/spermidine/putrescine transport system ATPase subunit